MASTYRLRTKLLGRVAAPVFLAAALSACSSIPDWVDPTTWIGGDSQASSDQSSDTGAGTDQSADTGAGPSGAASQDAVAPPSDGQAPDIAAIPPKPTPPSTPDEQKQVADSLAADRSQAHYSADALRGGTEAAAPPPSAEPAQPTQAPETASSSQPPEAEASAADNQTAPSASDEQTASSAPAAPETAPPPAPAPNKVANADAASTSAPAAAPMAAETGAPPAAAAPDMQATFAPSRAPALDPSVSQFVPQQIISHYRETAAAASVPADESGTVAKRRHRKKAKTSQIVMPAHYS